MIKNLYLVSLLFFYSSGFSQVLTYVGNAALVTIQSQTLFYNGGGLQTTGTAVVNNSGNIMINGASTDLLNVATTSSVNLRLASVSDYGQLYIAGITQANITGKVNKEYTSDYINGTTGRQQIGLPFYNYKIDDLVTTFGTGNLNVTATTLNSAGRFNNSSAFWWNNARARFDQIAYSGTAYDASGNPLAAFISPMTYYILPRRKADGTFFWVPNTDKKTFSGTPASDASTSNVQIALSGGYAGSFGTNGNGTNSFGERYYSYVDDPFASKTGGWGTVATGYGRNLYQLANPFFTNLDLKFIATNETGNPSDGNYISNLTGIAYYGNTQITWQIGIGSQYGSAIVALTSGGAFQAGDISANRLVIKPMGAFMVKLSSATAQTLNLTKTRRFKFTSRADGVDYIVTAAKNNSESEDGDEGIPADKVVKQVAVIMSDLDGIELDRTYYAVSPTSVTGYNPEITTLQAYSSDKKLFTKEEKAEGGEDSNYTDRLYINEANEVDFKSKQIPFYIEYSEQPYQLKFELYEKGERVTDSGALSNGKSFYIKNTEGQFIKIVDGESLPSMSGNQTLGLYYELPEGGTLATGNVNNSQTIIAKKDAQWVVRFAKDWKTATVEVYSAAGQLLNTKSKITTGTDYSIPLNYQVKGVFLVKAVSEKGEVVIKKIIN